MYSIVEVYSMERASTCILLGRRRIHAGRVRVLYGRLRVHYERVCVFYRRVSIFYFRVSVIHRRVRIYSEGKCTLWEKKWYSIGV